MSASTTPPAISAPPPSIEALLTRHAKQLKPGQTISFTLIKSNNTTTSTDRDGKHELKFPRIAKFNESVKKPDFENGLRDGRFYEEEVPKAKEDSDDEEESSAPEKKKKRRRRPIIPKRHWVLSPSSDSPSSNASDIYYGQPESNPSQYVLFSIRDPADPSKLELNVSPAHGFHTFSQPKRVASMSMNEAEQAISDQRKHLTRYMMHSKLAMKGEQHAALAKIPGPPVSMPLSKARLLGKLAQKQEEDGEVEDEDVMADLAFRNRKGVNSKARKELLSDLGDEGVTVDDDGVLGGVNDSEFAGKRRFGRLAVSKRDSDDTANKKTKAKDVQTTHDTGGGATFEAGAIDDDFYQRDVAAEYDNLDYDANEQFDDDDVDLGQNDVEIDNAGFAQDNDDEDGDDEEFEEEGAGLASKAGLKDMLAKARGENLNDNANANADQGADKDKGKKTAYNRPDEPNVARAGGPGDVPADDHALPKPTANDANKKRKSDALAAAAEEKKPKFTGKTGVELDDNGQRLISLEAIRREIWLHHGQIRMKRLMKIFSIKKNTSQERQNRFREVVKELCTMKVDKVEGNMLVLKQHYSNMG